eukprot:g33224.t1
MKEKAIKDAANSLDLLLVDGFLDHQERRQLWQTLVAKVDWYRVKYKSFRHGNACETPCWTNLYGGLPGVLPYAPVPGWLQPLVDRVSTYLSTPFNALLVRLYLDGEDNIAWHTDGRSFLGPEPVIASLSLGAPAKFEMRKMTDVWPSCGQSGIDTKVEARGWTLGSGDLLVMRGKTQ